MPDGFLKSFLSQGATASPADSIHNVATLTANNSAYLGGVAAASYVNTSGAYTLSGIHTHSSPLVINNNQGLRFQTVNTAAYSYFTQQNDDNFVFYTTNTTIN